MSFDQAAQRSREPSLNRDELWLPTPALRGGWHATMGARRWPACTGARTRSRQHRTRAYARCSQHRTKALSSRPPNAPLTRSRPPRAWASAAALPAPRGPLTGLDTGGFGGSGSPTVEPSGLT